MTAPPPEPAALAALERLDEVPEAFAAGLGDQVSLDQMVADLALVRAALAAQAQREQRLTAANDRARAALTAWRYRTRECPVCTYAIHTADCALVAALAALDAPEGPPHA